MSRKRKHDGQQDLYAQQTTIHGSKFWNTISAAGPVFQGNVATGPVSINIGDSTFERIVNWLAPEPYNGTHVEMSQRRQEDTGQWFLNEVDAWLVESDNPQPFFWCRGIPGAGKTVLMSAVVDEIQLKPSVDGIAYMYFNYKQRESQTLTSVYASLVAQLLSQIPALRATVEDLYKKHGSGRQLPTAEEFFGLLTSLPQSCKVVLAFDALDEASEQTRKPLLNHLEKLGSTSLRVFLTSRPDIHLKSIAAKTRILDVIANDSDLRAFAQAHLEDDEVQDVLGEHSRSIVPQIVEGVISHAAGMFLLVVFQIRHICSQTCAAEMLEASLTMPSDPDSIYDRTMEQINSQPPSHARLARRVLLWLVLAKRMLSVQEMVEALAIEPNTTELNRYQKRQPLMLVKVCRGLAIVDEASAVVRLAHLTVQDYLARKFAEEIPLAQKELTLSIATYLSFSVFMEGPCRDDESLEERLTMHPFARYASHQLAAHLQDLTEDQLAAPLDDLGLGHTLQEILYVFATSQPLLQSYFQLLEIRRGSLDERVTPLHIAAQLGVKALMVQLLLKNEVNIEVKDEYGRTALMWAVLYGHEKVISLLLENGADIEARDEGGKTALLWAACNGDEEVARQLLENGADIEARNEGGKTALLWAAWLGHVAMVGLLLEKGAYIEARDEGGKTALLWAAWNGNEEVARQLLENGANIEARDEGGKTALLWAAWNRNEEVARQLLENGADTEARDKDGKTALLWAAWNGNEEVARQLLENGADTEARDKDGKTALLWAAWNGNEEVARQLLENGADTEARDKYGKTALLWAWKGNEEVARQLLENGADIEARDEDGRTALIRVMLYGYEKATSLLLEKGADTEARGEDGKTALMLAAEDGDEGMARLLLENRADTKAKDKDGKTALLTATERGQKAVIRLLSPPLEA